MKYKLLGKTGLRVSEICLGTMGFGQEWGWGTSKADSKKVFDEYVKHGGNFVDTANLYTEGTSEKYVGEFIASDREHFVLATKYSLFDRKNDPNFAGNHKKNMIRSLNESLKRLKVEYIDLFWLHVWDNTTDVEELMRALDDVVRSGKVLHIGISDTPAWVVAKANTIARYRGYTPFSALQIEYSLFERAAERDLLPMAKDFGMTVTPWAPIAGGLLTGKYTDEKKKSQGRLKEDSLRLSERGIKIAKAVDNVAHKLGKPQSQVAINWIRQQHPNSIPILGATSPNQLTEGMKCIEFELSKEDIAYLSKESEIALGFPHDFIARQNVQDFVFSWTRDQIDF